MKKIDKVTFEVRLDTTVANFSKTDKIEKFEKNMAKVLKVDASALKVIGVRSGSVIIKFTVEADEDALKQIETTFKEVTPTLGEDVFGAPVMGVVGTDGKTVPAPGYESGEHVNLLSGRKPVPMPFNANLSPVLKTPAKANGGDEAATPAFNDGLNENPFSIAPKLG